MRVMPGLVPLAADDRTTPSPTAQPARIALTLSNERSSRDPGTHDP
jgi:hypothetical protein